MKTDREFMERAIAVALEAERLGNLPIGAVITIDGEVLTEAGNALLKPVFNPGRHAEMEALRRVPPGLWPRSREMTCYSTLEPCVMCFGALLLHGFGRVVFGAADTLGGAGMLIDNLPSYYGNRQGVPQWTGPISPEHCDELFTRSLSAFDQIPSVGRSIKE
jgi:tRNA(adenine34) deaminase